MSDTPRFIVCELKDSDFDSNSESGDVETYRFRCAARGLLFREGKVALLHVSTKNFHKLPGGGIEEGETAEEGFIREILEETGCKCTIIEGNHVTFEFRDKIKLFQLSYIFSAEVVGEAGEASLESDEIEIGHDLEWVALDGAVKLLESQNPSEYEDKFIHLRELEILRFYQRKELLPRT